MPISMVFQCIDCAQSIQIPRIALTGGEPTLREDINDIIRYIQDNTNCRLTLTTNGLHLDKIETAQPIDSINLSVFSFKSGIEMEYQNVDPEYAILQLKKISALEKSLNVLITRRNWDELDTFVDVSQKNSFHLNIMFEKTFDEDYLAKQKELLDNLINSYDSMILLQTTPTLHVNIGVDSSIKVKHPIISSLVHSTICDGCNEYQDCFEKVCAIRVHPDGIVTPCLSRHLFYSQGTIEENIREAYSVSMTRTLFRHSSIGS